MKTLIAFLLLCSLAHADEWVTPPYSQSNFFTGCAGAVWTVPPQSLYWDDQHGNPQLSKYRYKLLDANTVIVQAQIENTSVSGTTCNALGFRLLPPGRVAARWITLFCRAVDNGYIKDSYCSTGSGDNPNIAVYIRDWSCGVSIDGWCRVGPMISYPAMWSQSNGGTSVYVNAIVELKPQ